MEESPADARGYGSCSGAVLELIERIFCFFLQEVCCGEVKKGGGRERRRVPTGKVSGNGVVVFSVVDIELSKNRPARKQRTQRAENMRILSHRPRREGDLSGREDSDISAPSV